MTAFHDVLTKAQTLFLRLTFALICAAAVGAVVATALSAAGVWPWLTLQAGLDGTLYPQAGMVAQIALTALAVMLAFYLPSNGRMLALETSHRKFSLQMEDVARAYHAAHAADRKGLFNTASEFDAVKERLAFMRSHPDLGNLEPEVLEVAAQMSQISQDLAKTYSDANVQRARTFLKQRQEEVEAFQGRLEDIKAVVAELRQWTRDVEIEESLAKSQLSRLREEVFELMPELSAQLHGTPDGTDPGAGTGSSVVPMQPPRRAD
ncbi:DNA repair protein [Cribrihabitans neustonicus]|uniref:DNA repair protein n=1 Tax=Cribrihabitans neustonicus TaxID=1429085 RepID=UPI003B5939B9